MKRIGYIVSMMCGLGGASRYFVAVLLLSMQSTAQADCVDSWLWYRSSNVDISVYFEDGCYQGDLLIDYVVKTASIKDKKGITKFAHKLSGSISFNQECTVLKRSDRELITTTTMFRCREDGNTPLAGATYKESNDGEVVDCGEPVGSSPSNIFRCVAGCGSFTPPVLYTLNGCD